MSKGFPSAKLSDWVLDGIDAAFKEWLEMSGEWLHTAPEYLLTVKVAQKLKKAIPSSKRTLLMEPHVAGVLAGAGGVQRGPKATKLRAGGRYDIVLGHGNRIPRAVIELKNPLWARGGAAWSDLHRICDSLLHGKAKTQLYTGLFAFYTSSAEPKAKGSSAEAHLQRKWDTEWRPKLESWAWAGNNQGKYSEHLKIALRVRTHPRPFNHSTHAWAAVCVQITRKPRRKLAGTKKSFRERNSL
jgi:hypothetical protein